MMLIPNWQRAVGNEALSYFGLKFLPETCQDVIDHLSNDQPFRPVCCY